MRRPLLLACLIGIFFFVFVFGELGLIVLAGCGVYAFMKRKRQRDRFELQMQTLGITPDEMRYWAKRAADPHDPMQKDMRFLHGIANDGEGNTPPSSDAEVVTATLEEVMKATSRIALSQSDKQYLLRFLKIEERNGLIVRFPPNLSMKDIASLFDLGVVWLHCPQIESDILFIKVRDGIGFFGRERSRFVHYLSEPNRNAFMADGSHKHLMLGLTGINNIFRAHGLARGMVT